MSPPRLLLKGDRQNTETRSIDYPGGLSKCSTLKWINLTKSYFGTSSIESTAPYKLTLLASSLFSSVDAINKLTCLVCLLTLLCTYTKVLVLVRQSENDLVDPKRYDLALCCSFRKSLEVVWFKKKRLISQGQPTDMPIHIYQKCQ